MLATKTEGDDVFAGKVRVRPAIYAIADWIPIDRRSDCFFYRDYFV
jgi:hypothetical protein